MTETMTLERIQYQERQTSWRTPRGQSAVLVIRDETSDWNTVNSIMGDNDEYGFAGLHLTGLALDVGSHIGTAAIALALDNPELRVVAVEAVSENAELARRNVELNGLGDRVTVIHAAAAAPGVKSADVFWRAQGNPTADHHAFIGNSSLVYDHGDPNHETETVGCFDLGAFVSRIEDGYFTPDISASLLKIDCEGCEWGFLTSPVVAQVERIVGEWHPTGGHTQSDLVTLLADTHDVTFTGSIEGPGGFVAVRR